MKGARLDLDAPDRTLEPGRDGRGRERRGPRALGCGRRLPEISGQHDLAVDLTEEDRGLSQPDLLHHDALSEKGAEVESDHRLLQLHERRVVGPRSPRMRRPSSETPNGHSERPASARSTDRPVAVSVLVTTSVRSRSGVNHAFRGDRRASDENDEHDRHDSEDAPRLPTAAHDPSSASRLACARRGDSRDHRPGRRAASIRLEVLRETAEVLEGVHVVPAPPTPRAGCPLSPRCGEPSPQPVPCSRAPPGTARARARPGPSGRTPRPRWGSSRR